MSEHDEQADLISWLMDQLPDFPEIHPLFFANPNDLDVNGTGFTFSSVNGGAATVGTTGAADE